MSEICAHFGVCGGCSHQDKPYAEQLAAKEKIVREQLGELQVKTFHPILPSPDIFFYRNKMEFSFGDERDIAILERRHVAEEKKTHVGLHPKGRFALVTPTPDCKLLSEESRVINAAVCDWANEFKVSIYVRKNNTGDLRHLVIREGKNTGSRMVNLVAKTLTPHVDELAKRLQKCGVPISTFLWTQYDGLSDMAKGDDRKVYWGEGIIWEKLAGVGLYVNPNSFMQTNTRAAEQMIKVLKSWIPSPLGAGNEVRPQTLIDLYCGSGSIGLALAKDFNEVIGVELNKDAVADAKRNALANKISNIQFMEGKAEALAPILPVKEKAQQTTVVVDPPRPGLHPDMTQTLLDWQVPSVFYVSCNPETLSRDLRALMVRYDILDAQPMDFFPHTDHIETAVRLRLK